MKDEICRHISFNFYDITSDTLLCCMLIEWDSTILLSVPPDTYSRRFRTRVFPDNWLHL